MVVEQFFIPGLGCESYLIGDEAAGVAAVIDPDRDVSRYLEAAQARGLKITHIVETHLHADHVSGNTDLAARTGAAIYLHEQAGAEFPHQTLKAGDTLTLGGVRLTVLHTPGHTPESITLLAAAAAPEPELAFTGDTLFAGDIGRPDLVGAEAARGLAQAMHGSLFNQLLPLADTLVIYPGHGAGSLCGKAIADRRSTTLGHERQHNPALAPRPLEAFVEYATQDLPEQPGNHKRIKALNRRGPRPLGALAPRPLDIPAAVPHFQRGAALLDARPKADYVRLHVPGAVHLEADDQLSQRVGFILPADVPLVLLLADPAQYLPVVYSLARVGFENVVGYLADSLERWQAFGLPVTSGDVQDVDALALQALLEGAPEARPVVVDVREPWEYRQGHIPGAQLMPLGELGRRLQELNAEQPVAVVCASGSRSQSAAALLGQKGFKTIYNLRQGMMDWMRQRLPQER